jgi:hypothetical protein
MLADVPARSLILPLTRLPTRSIVCTQLCARWSLRLQYWAVVAVGFLISARTDSVVGLTPDAVRLSPDAVLVELRVFKNGTSGHAPRVPICISTSGEADTIRRLFHLLITSVSVPSLLWFCDRDLSIAAAAILRAVGAVAPPGTRYTPRYLRSAGISAAYAVGILIERIMRVRNHPTTAVVLRHYLDPLMPPTPAARYYLIGLCPIRAPSPCRFNRSRFPLAIRSRPPSPLCCRVTFRYL